MVSFNDVEFGSFGDHRDQYRGAEQPYFREEVYQPPGSKNRFALHESNGSVTARRIGKPDSILPGGRPAKQIAGGLSVWGGGTGSPEGHKEILRADVRPGFRGTGLSQAMLQDGHRPPPQPFPQRGPDAAGRPLRSPQPAARRHRGHEDDAEAQHRC